MAKQEGKKKGHAEKSYKSLESGGVSADVLAQVQPGVTVRVHQIVTEKTAKGEEKKRIQIFEGIILSRNHGSEPSATFTVRKLSEGIGVERIFPLYSPWIAAIDIVKRAKVRRAKLNYLRSYNKRLKEQSLA